MGQHGRGSLTTLLHYTSEFEMRMGAHDMGQNDIVCCRGGMDAVNFGALYVTAIGGLSINQELEPTFPRNVVCSSGPCQNLMQSDRMVQKVCSWSRKKWQVKAKSFQPFEMRDKGTCTFRRKHAVDKQRMKMRNSPDLPSS